MRTLGINLAASESNATGIAELEDNKIRTFSVYKDKDIKEIIERFRPDVICISNPITLSSTPFRIAEKEMIKMGYDPEPQNMGDNKQRIKRAIEIKAGSEQDSEVIECHLPSVKKVLNLEDPKQLNNVRIMNIMKNQTEKDSVFAAVTALFYEENMYEEFGDTEQGKVIIPKVI